MGRIYFTLTGIFITTINIKKCKNNATISVIAISYSPIYKSLIAVIIIAYFFFKLYNNTYAKRKNTKNSYLML